MNSWDYTEKKLEREAVQSSAGDKTSLTSIAISMKRIADALEKIVDVYSRQQGGRVG